jgi:predicted sugar kinase
MANTNQAKCKKKERIIYTAECFRRGMGTMAIAEHLKEFYGIGETTARTYIREANKWLTNYDDCSFIADVRAKQIARAELILENAIAERNWKVANNVIDTLNKTLGIYEQKQKIEITSNEIQFKFGGVENNIDGETGTEENL